MIVNLPRASRLICNELRLKSLFLVWSRYNETISHLALSSTCYDLKLHKARCQSPFKPFEPLSGFSTWLVVFLISFRSDCANWMFFSFKIQSNAVLEPSVTWKKNFSVNTWNRSQPVRTSWFRSWSNSSPCLKAECSSSWRRKWWPSFGNRELPSSRYFDLWSGGAFRQSAGPKFFGGFGAATPPDYGLILHCWCN